MFLFFGHQEIILSSGIYYTVTMHVSNFDRSNTISLMLSWNVCLYVHYWVFLSNHIIVLLSLSSLLSLLLMLLMMCHGCRKDR